MSQPAGAGDLGFGSKAHVKAKRVNMPIVYLNLLLIKLLL